MIDDIISFSSCGPQAILANSTINTKIEMKKMEFGPTKCHTIHIGNRETKCPLLKVHDYVIGQKTSAKYLGDVICDDASNYKTTEERRNQGIGAISQITSLMNQIELGPFYFEVLFILRDT